MESEVYYVPHVIIPNILFKWIVATNQFDIGGFICHYMGGYIAFICILHCFVVDSMVV